MSKEQIRNYLLFLIEQHKLIKNSRYILKPLLLGIVSKAYRYNYKLYKQFK